MAGERKRPSVVVRFSGRGGNTATIINDVIGPQRVKFHNIHIIPCSYHKQKLCTQFLNFTTQPSPKPAIQPFPLDEELGYGINRLGDWITLKFNDLTFVPR